jgi:hypothetical protein
MAHPNQALVAEGIRLRQSQDHLQRRIDGIQGRPATTAELRDMRDMQARADGLYRDLGLIGAPGPLSNESATGYRRRLLGGLQPYSKDWSKARLAAIPTSQLDPIEKFVYDDAAKVAADPG